MGARALPSRFESLACCLLGVAFQALVCPGLILPSPWHGCQEKGAPGFRLPVRSQQVVWGKVFSEVKMDNHCRSLRVCSPSQR